MDEINRNTLEEKLKASEKRYLDLFERVAQGILITTIEGSVVDCNQAMLDMLGYEDKDEFLSINIKDDLYFYPEKREKFQRAIEEKGFLKDYPLDFKKRNGEKITIHITCNTRFDEGGSVIGYQGIIIDITGRLKMEMEVREANKRFEKIAELGNNGILVFGEDHRIEFANSMASEITGYSMYDLLGMEIKQLLDKLDRRFLEYILESERDYYARKFSMELEIKTAKNETRYTEVFITINRNRDSEIKTYVYINDITERKKMEREIREKNQFLTKLIESSVDSIIVADMKGDILIFNKGAEEILGYKAEEVIGKINVRDVYLPGVAKELMKKMRSTGYGGPGRLKSQPMITRNKNGDLIDGSISAGIIYDDDNREIATVGIFTDLRHILDVEKKLRDTQQQLLHSEKLAAMGRLTSQIAHELNNPIYGIMNTLELLKSEVGPGSKRRRVLDMALSESERVSKMLHSMLVFAKPLEEERRSVDVNKMLEDIIIFHEKQLLEANIKVKSLFDPKLPGIMASPNQLIQVILNIINNAKNAMQQGGSLTIETFSKEKNVIINITDTGTGIPEEIKGKIFDAFFTTKQAVKGVGLGLSVCYGIIKDHGGEILVKSEVGKGSTFSVILPSNA